MNGIRLYNELEQPIGFYLEGVIRGVDGDILVGEKSLKQYLQRFFDVTCKHFWIGSLDAQPESYAVRYIIVHPNGSFNERIFMSEWIGGNKGYDWVIEHNEDIFDLLGEYEGCYLLFGI